LRFIFLFFTFWPPNWGVKWQGKVGAHFGVVGKPIPDFLIPVHWRYFNISSGLLSNLQNTAIEVWFSLEGSLGRYINRLRSHGIQKLFKPNQTRGVDLTNEPRTKAVWWTSGWFAWHTYTHTHITATLLHSAIKDRLACGRRI